MNNVKMSVRDNLGKIYAAGRDLHLYKPEFFTPHLDDYDDSGYVSPIIGPTLVARTIREKFLVLGGDGYDKSALARHIAWKALEENPGHWINVQEWTNNANPQNFVMHLQENDEPTIFILPNISPQNVDYNLYVLYKIARDNGQCLIISTNNPLEKWKLEKDVKQLFWQPDPSAPLYDPNVLLTVLLKKLTEASHTLPVVLRDRELKPGEALMGNLLLSEVAVKLKTPESIETFVKVLTSFKKPVKESDILELVENCQNDRRAIRQWYYGFLSPREQLTALVLCLFDGFYDDQFFAAAEELFEQSWRKRTPSLPALDYCDLDSLSNYYSLIPVGHDGMKRVESHLPDQRFKLLETAWNSHRRQILSTFPVMENLVKHSVLPGFMNRELYGTDERRSFLRDVIGETLCGIGLISIHSIKNTLLEDSLLRLAAEEEPEVQAVAAHAMARWRHYEQDEKLFDTLERWQNEDTIQQRLELFLKDRAADETGKYSNPRAYIKAAVALTVGYAALYDPPDQLNGKLLHLLKQMAKDTSNPFIHIRFSRYTLPQVVRLHVNQLRDLLLDMTRYPWLNESIGASLALAYRERPLEVVEILDSWFETDNRKRSHGFAKNETNHHDPPDPDAILATVAFAYGWMQYNENKGPITIEDGFRRLKTILRKEVSPYARKAAVIAVVLQIVFNFGEVEKYLSSLFASMYKDEIEQIIDELVEIHLGQRADLGKGDNLFQWDDRLFPTWDNREPQVTDVEKVIGKWMKDNSNKITQQIAFRFKMSQQLFNFEQEEQKFIAHLERKKKSEEQKRKNWAVHSAPSFEATKEDDKEKVTLWIVSWLVTLKEKKYMGKIHGLLPEVIKQDRSNREILDFVLKKMHKDPDHEIRTIAEKLMQALAIVNKRGVFIFSFILLAAAVVFLLLM